MATIRYVHDPQKPRELSAAERARLDALTEEAIELAAASDLDNPPLTPEELERGVIARRVRRARMATGLSQTAFAACYHLPVGTVRDWEQGRSIPDAPALTLLRIIEREPEAVLRALAE